MQHALKEAVAIIAILAAKALHAYAHRTSKAIDKPDLEHTNLAWLKRKFPWEK